MINVFCSLIVMICMNQNCSYGIEGHASAHGKVVASNSTKYVVDFSTTAKEQNWMGDYSKKMVEKTECVRMDK